MTQFIHKTNNTTAAGPIASEIQAGEICLNTANLGSASDGINNGRLYIKTQAGEVRRFISLGLAGSSDPSLKVKYGGTNNTFGDLTSVTANTDGGDSVLIIRRDSNGNHTINRTPTNKLTWDSGNNRLNINRTSAGSATLHVGGDVAIDTIADRTTSFDSQFYILGSYNPGTTNNLRKILSTNFVSYFPNSSIPISKLSGSIPVDDNSVSSAKISGLISLEKGGTGANLSSDFGSDNGSIVYFSGTTLTYNSNFKWDNPNSTFVLNGAFEFDPPNDTLDNAVAVGVNSANKIVRMDYTFNQNLRDTDTVEFSKLTLSGSSSDTLVIPNITTDSTASVIGVNNDEEVVKLGFTLDQNLNTTNNITFNKLTLNNSASAIDALVMNNPSISSSSSDKIVCISASNYILKTNYSIDQNLRTTDPVDFTKLELSSADADTLKIPNINTNSGGSALEITAGGNVYKASSTRRVKENIVDYNRGLEEVLLMNPKYFNMINDPNKTLRAGLIAEDLADIGLDEFVVKDSDDNPSAINYDKIVVVLINAIKELKNRLDNISSN